jgi:hypothetical protein
MPSCRRKDNICHSGPIAESKFGRFFLMSGSPNIPEYHSKYLVAGDNFDYNKILIILTVIPPVVYANVHFWEL